VAFCKRTSFPFGNGIAKVDKNFGFTNYFRFYHFRRNKYTEKQQRLITGTMAENLYLQYFWAMITLLENVGYY
jgi:hypothetical protein